MEQQPSPHIAAHTHSSHHRDELLASTTCGCFYCLATFTPGEILDWFDEPNGRNGSGFNSRGKTALCPKCGIDSVIGDQAGYPLTVEFLSQMRGHWFGAAR